jgi:hypothetical protein
MGYVDVALTRSAYEQTIAHLPPPLLLDLFNIVAPQLDTQHLHDLLQLLLKELSEKETRKAAIKLVSSEWVWRGSVGGL